MLKTPQCNPKAMKTTMTIMILAAVTVSLAYAEPDFTRVNPDCQPEFNMTTVTSDGTYTTHKLTCMWEVNEIVRATAIQENLTDTEQLILDKIREEKENGTYIRPPIDTGDNAVPYGFGDVVDTVPESCKRTNPKPSDIEECNLDSKMGFCERGIQSTNPIQQYEYFAVTKYTPRDDLQIDLQKSSPLVKKLKEFEECRAELALIIKLNKTHYVGISKQVAKGEYNPYHADFVTTDFEFPAGETEATPSEIAFQDRRAHNTFCAIEYIQESLRKEQGCTPKVYKGYYKNSTGITDFEAMLIESEPMVEYYKYKESDGKDYYPKWIKKHTFPIQSLGTSGDAFTQWEFVTNED